jgi:hypothetical protein
MKETYISRPNPISCCILPLMRIALSLFYILILTSCASTTKMYSGPGRPATETALIRGVDSSIDILSCDGTKLSSNSAILLPGEHTVDVTYRERDSGGYSLAGSIRLQWMAEAGHTYIVEKSIHASSRPGMSAMYIIDQATNKNVSTGVLVPGTEESKLRMIETKIKEFPQRLEFQLDRAYLLMALKRYEEALEASTTCTLMNFNSAPAWKLKSEALCELKRYDQALDAITKAIHLRPIEQDWYLERNRIRERLGQTENDLRATFGEVISIGSSRLTIHHATRPFVVKEEYDSNTVDISAIKVGDKVYIEYIDGKPRILKSIEKQN